MTVIVFISFFAKGYNFVLPCSLAWTVDKTDPEGAGHAVETMDAATKAPALLSEDIP